MLNFLQTSLLSQATGSPQASLNQRIEWCPHKPHPKQEEFLALDCFEAFYGGGAGGGKSDALLMSYLQYVHVPRYAGLIVRRTFSDLAQDGAIMSRMVQWMTGKPAHWNRAEKRFTFPSGATLTFGYLKDDASVNNYQGAEFQFVGVDEITQLPERRWRYLMSRLRKPSSGQLSQVPLRFRAGGNPGGISHDAVYRRYVTANDPDRVFVPALLADNPSLDQAAYRKSLESLDETTRKQLLEGVWIRNASGLVYQWREELRAPALQSKTGWTFVVGIDYGFTDETAWCVIGWNKHTQKTHVVYTRKESGLTPTQAGEITRELVREYNPIRIVGDVGGLGKAYAEEARARFGIPIEPAQKQNKAAYQKLLNDALRHSRVMVCDGNDDLIDEWAQLPWADESCTKEAAGFPNHISDATLYAWRESFDFLEPPPPMSRVGHDSEEYEERAKRMAERELSLANRRRNRR